MKKPILTLFILLIFSQLAFSQNDIFAKYLLKYPNKRKYSNNIDLPRHSLTLYKDSTFIINYGGCLNGKETGKWEISNDVLTLFYNFDFTDEPVKIKHLIIQDKLLSLKPDNKIIKSKVILTKIQ